MSTEVKALILCNNPIAIPCIREFLFYGKVGAIVVTKRNKEMQQLISNMTGNSPVPLIMVDKKDYQEKLANIISEQAINVGLMMTFPFRIPENILQLPARGFINFHFGLLPECRGPHPILWHLLNNDGEAGVTVHKVDGGIDTGEIIMQERMEIEATDTYGSLQSKLAYLATRPAANLLKILSFGSIVPSVAQDESKARYFEMPGPAELMINWDHPAEKIIRLINACNPWNKGAGAMINEWMIGITEAEPGEELADETAPGTIITCDKERGLQVKTGDNKTIILTIVYLQEGFYSGHRLTQFGISQGMRFQF